MREHRMVEREINLPGHGDRLGFRLNPVELNAVLCRSYRRSRAPSPWRLSREEGRQERRRSRSQPRPAREVPRLQQANAKAEVQRVYEKLVSAR
jgi:hypothetical protein